MAVGGPVRLYPVLAGAASSLDRPGRCCVPEQGGTTVGFDERSGAAAVTICGRSFALDLPGSERKPAEIPGHTAPYPRDGDGSAEARRRPGARPARDGCPMPPPAAPAQAAPTS